jgi:hypothetical protein
LFTDIDTHLLVASNFFAGTLNSGIVNRYIGLPYKGNILVYLTGCFLSYTIMLVHDGTFDCEVEALERGKRISTEADFYAVVTQTMDCVNKGENALLNLGFVLIEWAIPEGQEPTVENVVSFYQRMAAPTEFLQTYTRMWPLLSKSMYKSSKRGRSHLAVCICLKKEPALYNQLLTSGHLQYNIPVLRRRYEDSSNTIEGLAMEWLQRKQEKECLKIEAKESLLQFSVEEVEVKSNSEVCHSNISFSLTCTYTSNAYAGQPRNCGRSKDRKRCRGPDLLLF